jgi:hypothetical protein
VNLYLILDAADARRQAISVFSDCARIALSSSLLTRTSNSQSARMEIGSDRARIR